ncbi:MAG: tryptophan-rich sensory protein [Anaerolineae bacterium]
MKNRLLSIVNVIITLATIVVNALANALPINGQNTGEISDRFDIYFVPAGYVFSIWGLIYLGLIAFAIYQALPSQQDNPHVRRIGWVYTVSGLANIAWIFLWHYERFVLTVPVMLVILVSLILIFLRLWSGRDQISTADRWAIVVPFSIYLGWISVATVANATQLLYFLDWGGWGIGAHAWAVIMLVVAAAIALAMSVRHAAIAYDAVFVWAYIGIALKHWDTPAVGITAAVLAGVIGLALLSAIPRYRRVWSLA